MKVLKLVFKNSLRHKLRTFLTVLGIAIAVIAFGLLRTVVTAWNAGVDTAAANRLITRQAVSFIFPLPYAYKDKIAAISGVKTVSFQNWFGGNYIDQSHFFPRLAVDPETIFDVYPEFHLDPKQREAFRKERNSCIVGSDIAKQYGFKLGQVITIEGDIYPGRWDFVVRGIYTPADKFDGTQMLFHWNYVNERMKEEAPGRSGDVGWYVFTINDPNQAGRISSQVDGLFKNSTAETKTETERAFTQNFISSLGAIITAMNVMSFVIVGIIMLVLGNTMIMSARERTREYSVLKTLGFSANHLVGLILGESLVISAIGGGLGLLLTFPIIKGFEQAIPKNIMPVFQLEPVTVIFAVSAAFLIGILASIFPIQRTLTTKIVEGFRFVG